ncbi:MAG: class I SAM-dependent methyltransferase [Gemmataceae bacterium]
MSWHEDDSFWLACAPFLFRGARGDEAVRQAQQVLALLQPDPIFHLLDLACGVGRHSIELARRGCLVTGVDRTDAYLDEARRRAAEEGLEIEWIREDMRRFRRPDAFDAAVSLLSSFGYFERDTDEQETLANVHASLKPGGRLVMDLLGKEVLARTFRPRDWQEDAERKTFLLEERQVRSGWQYIDNRWLLLDGASQREFRWSIRIYSGGELEGLLRGAGFHRVTLYGDLSGAPYDNEARRLVALAVK